jgi:beta-glucanase (GH16 family)
MIEFPAPMDYNMSMRKVSIFLRFILGTSLTLLALTCAPVHLEYTFSDEFNGPSGAQPDPAKWERQEYNRRPNTVEGAPDGWWMKEDAYLDGNGHLVIRVKQIPNTDGDTDPFDYSSGNVRTRGRFEQRFGQFEIRCRMPTMAGWWVAFWLMSDSQGNIDGSGRDGTEIDIMEGFGWTERMQSALHWDGYGASHQSDSKSSVVPGLLSGFHTFRLDWSPTEYVFYVDDIETWRTTSGGVSQVPAFVKITGELSTEAWAVGSGWANPQPLTYPDYFIVDYVHVRAY